MGQTIVEKILSAHSGREVRPGETVVADIDFAFAQDGTAPLVIQTFNEIGANGPFDPKKVVFIIDHNSPSPNENVSRLHGLMRSFAGKYGIKLYDIGCGICHQIISAKGHVSCGDLIVGADSHTSTCGALNAAGIGMGSADIAAAVIGGKSWFRVPQSIKLVLQGKLSSGVYAKDIVLYLIGQLGADGANYQAVEFFGPIVDDLSMDGRFTICNMAVEMGAKVGIMNADAKTAKWLRSHSVSGVKPIAADPDARYNEVLTYDLGDLEPQVALPHRVDKVSAIGEVEGTKIDEAFLGTCTNGRLEDLRIAAAILKKKKVHPDMRFLVAPASKEIYLSAAREGIIETFLKAGVAIIIPGCGPCCGTHQGIPADGESVISTANRNFKGRMGNPRANIFLASPATVAASAVTGTITDPRKHLE
jgi:3-isopropylmalate/(R)-2-methylmalate dehydratase large subunit